jgi:hypothetical protein
MSKTVSKYSKEGKEETKRACYSCRRPSSPGSGFPYFRSHCRVNTTRPEYRGEKYGTKEFKDKVYKGHRRIVNKTKWQAHDYVILLSYLIGIL